MRDRAHRVRPPPGFTRHLRRLDASPRDCLSYGSVCEIAAVHESVRRVWRCRTAHRRFTRDGAILLQHSPTDYDHGQAHLPPAQYEASSQARLPCPHGNQVGPRDAEPSPPQGTQAAFGAVCRRSTPAPDSRRLRRAQRSHARVGARADTSRREAGAHQQSRGARHRFPSCASTGGVHRAQAPAQRRWSAIVSSADCANCCAWRCCPMLHSLHAAARCGGARRPRCRTRDRSTRCRRELQQARRDSGR